MITGAAYTGSRDLETVRRDMQSLVSLGYTAVCHLYSETDIEYYPETFKSIVSISKDEGLTVYASTSGIGRVFEGDDLSELAAKFPSEAQLDNQGNSKGAICPNSPVFQNYLRNWINFLSTSAIDVFFWDQPHFFSNEANSSWSCRCENCKKLFRKIFHHTMPASVTPSVQKFKTVSMVYFLAELTGLVRSYQKKNAVCLPLPQSEENLRYWEEIAELPTVDELSVKPYWEKGSKPNSITQNYHLSSKELKRLTLTYQKEASIWIKNFNIPKNTEQNIAEATYSAYNEGIRILMASDFMGSKVKSSRRSENPQRVWQIQTDAFAECQEKAIMNEMIDVMRSPRTAL